MYINIQKKRRKRVSSVQIVSLFLKASKLGQIMLNVICIWCSFFFFNKYGLTLMVPKTITYYIMGLLIKNKCVLNWHCVREFWDKKWQLNPSTNSLQVKNSFCMQEGRQTPQVWCNRIILMGRRIRTRDKKHPLSIFLVNTSLGMLTMCRKLYVAVNSLNSSAELEGLAKGYLLFNEPYSSRDF